MMFRRAPREVIFSLWTILLILVLFPVPLLSGSIPAVNSYLPEFLLVAPSSEIERTYLGIPPSGTFTISQVDCELLMIEIVGVYCPKCHTQMPLFNKLFHRINKDAALSKKVRIIAIAVGASPTELDYFKKEYRIPYPVFMDPEFKVHKLLGEPRTPFTMVILKNGKVVFAHLGVIQDMDQYLLQITNLLQ
ncbi:MAG: TlpA disulfide reductase family protein [Pseudomonadota bacterium]